MNVAQTSHQAYPPISAKTQLLISVQNQAEAERLFLRRIEFVDFKSPDAGPLAPVDPILWQWAARNRPAFGNQTHLSAALGEPDQATTIASQVPSSFAFAKIGISRLRTPQNLAKTWDLVRRRIPSETKLVAVAYADHHAARCAAPSEVFRVADDAGIKHLLIDTYRKSGPSSIQTLGWQNIVRMIQKARDREQFLTIAGSVRCEDARQFQRRGIAPDAFGIRGDVTIGKRSGHICVDRIAKWQNVIGRADENG